MTAAGRTSGRAALGALAALALLFTAGCDRTVAEQRGFREKKKEGENKPQRDQRG